MVTLPFEVTASNMATVVEVDPPILKLRLNVPGKATDVRLMGHNHVLDRIILTPRCTALECTPFHRTRRLD